MSQPNWKCVANLGDADPIEHGGMFVFIDQTGVYPPEMERVLPPIDEDVDNPQSQWEVRRCILEPCTYVDGVLSDNSHHPSMSAWFATTPERMKERPQDGKGLADVASFVGSEIEHLIANLTSHNAVNRAIAWQAIGDYHGWDNLDDYPFQLNEADATTRVDQYLAQIGKEPTQ